MSKTLDQLYRKLVDVPRSRGQGIIEWEQKSIASILIKLACINTLDRHIHGHSRTSNKCDLNLIRVDMWWRIYKNLLLSSNEGLGGEASDRRWANRWWRNEPMSLPTINDIPTGHITNSTLIIITITIELNEHLQKF